MNKADYKFLCLKKLLCLGLFLSLGMQASLNSAYALTLDEIRSKASELQQQRKATLSEIEKKAKPAGLIAYSDEEEAAIGRQIAGNLLGAAPLVKDNALQKYVNNVGRWVASQSERPDLAWHFGVISSSDINAFAAPGGYIFITLGLYQIFGDESELAGVLAHEIGHVIKKHHLKILQQSQLVDLGGKVLTKEVGENSEIRNLIGNGAEIVARSLDKNAEFEADRIAVVLATRAGYEAYGLPQVLQEIGHVGGDDRVDLLFKTHPHSDERLAQLGNAMDQRFDNVKGKALPGRLYKIK